MRTIMNRLLFILFLFSFNFFAAEEIPIGFTEQELLQKDMIGSNSRETDPPSAPVRNISEYERMSGVLIRYPLSSYLTTP